ncbi:FHA domain-containing protein FhaA [Corynebacterium provencense]|uniref:FHA domain-containing protein FhaA n=1 Tax=Corynebacterium provencense TaxID=1737425 RepID=A0A2Z3YSC2_9CORY|nr:DUF3662 and FHA domain-containing protein [Corynebacterium provencense]AWT24927.1 FHA domain-containing protein FhaA [Corynebacterium provencense]
MDLFGRFRKLDSSLQRGLDNGFARVFGGEVVPAEIDELLKQEAEDTLMEDRSGALHAPSAYEVHVAAHDHETLLSKRPDLDRELRDRLNRFIRNEGWSTAAPVTVDLVKDDTMHTGQLKCRSSFTSTHQREVGPREMKPADHGEDAAAPQWPRSEPDSGRNPVARPYDADSSSDGADNSGSPGGATGAPDAAGAAGAVGAAGAGALAGLAHPGRHNPGWGHSGDRDNRADRADRDNRDAGNRSDNVASSTPAADPPQGGEGNPQAPRQASDPSSPSPDSRAAHGQRPAPAPTEVVPGPSADPVNGVDGLQSTGSGGYQAAVQRTVTLHLMDGSDRTYELKQGSNTVGRGNQVDFRLPDTGVSRRHADITWDGFDAVLTDLDSTNGTTVNEIPVENWLLADGDVISVGHSDIEVRFS